MTDPIERLRGRPLPLWWRDAKFGVFVHWGPYSVPAWAPTGAPLPTGEDAAAWAAAIWRNPLAEWYWNSMSLPGSPTAEHHAAEHGGETYEDFAQHFRASSQAADVESWVDLFAAAGARYCVLTTKHHDGFLLWPSGRPCPMRQEWQTRRDIVGEVAGACRRGGLRFGAYYSGGIDWTFGGLGIDSVDRLMAAIPRTPDYLAYVDAHWRELIERYQPSVLWNDISHPGGIEDAAKLFDAYYERVPDGVVNNRFDIVAQLSGELHSDFITPEYREMHQPSPTPFEICRGLGTSFGWNREETSADLLSIAELVHLLVDVVSKGGNLLIDVGPTARGTVPALQRERLEALGGWLAVHAEAIYGTRAWTLAEAKLVDGTPVRFTTTDGALFVHMLGPVPPTVRLPALGPPRGTEVRLVGDPNPVRWVTEDGDLIAYLPGARPGPASVLRVFPAPIIR